MKISLPSVPGAPAASHHAAFAALGIISLLAHFLGLSHPAQVVFDEYHFGKFVNAYCCTRQMIFDIHPPHPKVIMSWFATLGGYTGNLGFTTIGESLQRGPILALRLWPAVTGTLIPLVAFLLLRRWRVPVGWAFTGGLALALDNALLIQTRIMSLDGQLILGSLLALWFCELLLEERSAAQRLWLSLAIGAAVAVAVSAKFTGLAILPVLLARMGWHVFDAGMKPAGLAQPMAGLAMGLVGFLVVYLAGWKAHFVLLDQPGPGDAFYKVTGNFFTDLFHLHKVMVTANNGITTSHPWSSPWWGWPLMRKPIFYWVDGDAEIYFAGNPFVWWALQGAAVILLARFAWSAATDRSRHDSLSIGIVLVLLVAWVAAYLPYSLVSRGLFLYHYLPPLIWSVLLSIFLWSRLSSRDGFKPWHLMTLILVGFAVASPVTFGFGLLQNLTAWILKLK